MFAERPIGHVQIPYAVWGDASLWLAAGRFFKRGRALKGFIPVVSREAPIIPIGLPRTASAVEDRPDDELMTLAAAGVLTAFGEVVRRYERQVRALCTKMLGSAGGGDDAAQEVFLELWRTCPRYDGRGQFRAFLFTAARNRCLKASRRRSPSTVPLDESGEIRSVIAAAPDQIDALLTAERRQQMDRLVSRLPPKLREVIWLRFAAELEYGEIAAIVHRSEEAVRTRVFNGLRRLRDLLGKQRSWR